MNVYCVKSHFAWERFRSVWNVALIPSFLLLLLLAASGQAQDDIPPEALARIRRVGITDEELEQLMKAPSEAPKAMRRLYMQFFPKTEDLGPGWRTEWEHPYSRARTEGAFWTQDGVGREQNLSLLIMGVRSLPREALTKLTNLIPETPLEYMIPELEGDMLSQVAPDLTKEEVIYGMIHLYVKMSLNPSFRRRAVEIGRLSALMQGPTQHALTLVDDRDEMTEAQKEKALHEYLRALLTAMTEKVQGRTVDQMREILFEEIYSIKKMCSLKYYQSPDWTAWDAKASEKQKRITNVHITLYIMDREFMAERVDDLPQENVEQFMGDLEQAFGAPYRSALAVKETLARRRQREVENAEDDDGRRRARERADEALKEQQEFANRAGAVKWNVDFRDFGDNCYIVSPSVVPPSLHLGHLSYITARNAYMRNGNAIVHLSVTGSVSEDTLGKIMDQLLAEMDAKTAFFRE